MLNSLRQGDNAYVHCVTGVSRAPRAAAVIGAKLMGITFEKAKYIITQVRNIKCDRSEKGMEGPWTNTVLRGGETNAAAPTGFSCRAPITGTVTVHATTLVNGRARAICHGKVGATGARDLEDGVTTTESIEAAARDMGGTFCAACKSLLRASLILKINAIY